MTRQADDNPEHRRRRGTSRRAVVAGMAGLAASGVARGRAVARTRGENDEMTVAPATATVTATQGMIAAPHHLAADAGLAVLKDGGTALDAAVAANAVLTVIYPDQTAIGGDCFLLYYEAKTGKLHGYNGSGRAPKAINAAAILAQYGAMPLRGILSVTVPGTIDAWEAALTRFGRFNLDRLLQPAIGYARDGFPIAPNTSANIAATYNLLAADPATSAAFLPNGRVPAAGDTLRLPALATSLEQIARGGRAVFYTGQIARQIAETSRRLGGALALDDLAAHHGDWITPLTTDYRGLTVAEMPPNSQGLTALVELNLVEQVKLPATWGSAAQLHPLIQAKNLAFAVRDRYLADPQFVKIDTAKLGSKAYAQELWRSYNPNAASPGPVTLPGDTVYIAAVDRDGNAASLIQSLYSSFGSGVIADGTGIVLQNRGAYFSLDPNSVDYLEPGKRPLHTLMPAMLLRDGKLVGPLGTQGGDAQAQVQLQLITDLVDYGMAPQAAIDAPRWLGPPRSGMDPYTVTLEDRFPAATIDGLRQLGYAPSLTSAYDIGFGQAQMILRDEQHGVWIGGADPRTDGTVRGF